MRYVAFLRAINTPPRHVKMARLRDVFTSLGFANVATHIASGNVIFDADASDPPDRLIERIEAALGLELGFDVPVFLRTSPEVLAVADGSPFPPHGEVEVSFLPAPPDAALAGRLEAMASGSDRLAVIGREVYWWHEGPRSASDHSEARVVRTLGMPTTQRSLRTVRHVADRFLRSP